MSLQIWFPFTTGGTAPSNKGLLDDISWTSEPSFSTDGKLGYCITNGTCTMTAEQTAKVLNNDEFSFSCWIYINADTGTKISGSTEEGIKAGQNMIFGSHGMRLFTLFLYPTVNDFHWSWDNYGEVTGNFAVGHISGVLPSYTWTHVALTYKNPNGTIYINGEKVEEFTGVSNSSSFAHETDVLSLVGGKKYFNDYRVYNNCISAKEVKELSKGLVIHNPFSGAGADNLLSNSYTCDGWINSGFIQSIDTDDGSTIMSGIRSGCDSAQYPYSFTAGRISRADALENGGITVSFDFKHDRILDNSQEELDNTKILIVTAVASDNTQISWTYPELNLGFFDGEWRRISVTLTNDDLLKSSADGFTADDIVGFDIKIRLAQNGKFHVKKLKVEKGLKSTLWVPNKSDSEYTLMGFDYYKNFRDVSGNGLYIGVPDTLSELINVSPRYDTAIKFIHHTSYGQAVVNGPNIYATKWNYTYTLNVWLKYVELKNISLFSIGNLELKTDDMYFYINNIQYAELAQFNDYDWHMYTIVSSNSEDSAPFLFIDGIRYTAINTESLGSDLRVPILPSGLTYASLRIRNQMTSDTSTNRTYLSDFRLYSTILNSDDVKTLYASPISIDKDGNLFACEFKEE